jgi:DNA processing protein
VRSPHSSYAPDQLLWPLAAAERKHAPRALFVAGDPDLLRASACVAVIGSRQASQEGLARADRLARMLVEHGVTVVSGLAAGIDTAAHTAAIAAGGRTIAVLGTPLDQCFPEENRALQDRIAREHLVISQFASGTVTRRRDFPMRNKTMALVSDATVIVEATDQSGTIRQGFEALRLSRGLWIAAPLLADARLEFPRRLARLGARELSDATLADLLAQLPAGRRWGG